MAPSTGQRQPCRVVVNGLPRDLTGPIRQNALDFLRGLGLTGCKEGCAEGECGACAILVARPAALGPTGAERTRWTALNACLLPAAALDGQEVITVEGLAAGDTLHPVQQELAVRGGSQCGYCTPGFVCCMVAEFYRNERGSAPGTFEEEALSGNLCRCTGYRPIRDAAAALGRPSPEDPIAARRDRPAPAPVATTRSTADGTFRRPATLTEAVTLLHDEPGSVIIAGGTDWGVEVNLQGRRDASVIAIDRLPELRTISWTDHACELGAALTLSELERELAGRIGLLEELSGLFASRLIRNAATLGGNLGTGSPIGDSPPALLALDATLLLVSAGGRREVPISDYFTGYRTTLRRPDELIMTIRIPLPLPGLTAFHKISKRRYDDISSVAVAYGISIEDGMISGARIGLGGVAATPLRATATEQALIGRPWTDGTIAAAAHILATEGSPLDDHRASARYRSAMLGMSLRRLRAEHPDPSPRRGVR